jgi:anti-sigma factor RsiW
MDARDDQVMIRYLLGGLSEDEQTRLEERFFADDDYFEQLLAVESELIDAYVRGELSGHEREQFETFFLASPRRRERVEFAKALMKRVSRMPEVGAPARMMMAAEPMSWRPALVAFLHALSPAGRWALAAAMVIVIGGGVWLVVQTIQRQTQFEQLQAERQELLRREQELQRQIAEQGANQEKLREQLLRLRNERDHLERELTKVQPLGPSVLSLALPPGLTRSIDTQPLLILRPGTRSVRLNLELGEDKYESYNAVLRGADDQELRRQTGLPVRRTALGQVVVWTLPADVLPAGDCTVTLIGVIGGREEVVDDYRFSVMKR